MQTFVLLPIHPKVAFVFLAAASHSRLISNLQATRTPTSLECVLLPSQLFLVLYFFPTQEYIHMSVQICLDLFECSFSFTSSNRHRLPDSLVFFLFASAKGGFFLSFFGVVFICLPFLANFSYSIQEPLSFSDIFQGRNLLLKLLPLFFQQGTKLAFAAGVV